MVKVAERSTTKKSASVSVKSCLIVGRRIGEKGA